MYLLIWIFLSDRLLTASCILLKLIIVLIIWRNAWKSLNKQLILSKWVVECSSIAVSSLSKGAGVLIITYYGVSVLNIINKSFWNRVFLAHRLVLVVVLVQIGWVVQSKTWMLEETCKVFASSIIKNLTHTIVSIRSSWKTILNWWHVVKCKWIWISWMILLLFLTFILFHCFN